ncbi:MAG: nitroreductase family protein [Brevinematales bacterium]|nr:nitroreductase family protein [Brevinematales bacterium]
MLQDLLKKNRSYRRYDESYRLTKETLAGLVELTRYCSSAMNLQPLRYYLSADPATNQSIFENTAWARLLGPSGTPQEGERPSGYILILGDKRLTQNFWCDHGIAAQSILLGAVEIGLGGLIIGSVNREGLSQALGIPEYYEIMLCLAIGKPVEKVEIEDMPPDGSHKYWRDEQKVHHVPKRPLSELIIDKL